MQKLLNDPRRNIKEAIAGPAAVILLLAFFMPWVTVSCEGYGGGSETRSGYELTKSETQDDVEQEGDAWLWIIPLAGVVTLVAVWQRLEGNLDLDMARVVYLVAGIVGLLLQMIKYFSLQSDLSDAEEMIGPGVIDLSYRFGWWITALALIALIVAAMITEEHLPASTKTPPQPPGSEPPPGGFGPI